MVCSLAPSLVKRFITAHFPGELRSSKKEICEREVPASISKATVPSLCRRRQLDMLTRKLQVTDHHLEPEATIGWTRTATTSVGRTPTYTKTTRQTFALCDLPVQGVPTFYLTLSVFLTAGNSISLVHLSTYPWKYGMFRGILAV